MFNISFFAKVCIDGKCFFDIYRCFENKLSDTGEMKLEERYRADQAHNSLNNIFEELKPNKEVSELFEVILKEKFENSEQSNKSLIKSLNEKILKVEKR